MTVSDFVSEPSFTKSQPTPVFSYLFSSISLTPASGKCSFCNLIQFKTFFLWLSGPITFIVDTSITFIVLNTTVIIIFLTVTRSSILKVPYFQCFTTPRLPPLSTNVVTSHPLFYISILL